MLYHSSDAWLAGKNIQRAWRGPFHGNVVQVGPNLIPGDNPSSPQSLQFGQDGSGLPVSQAAGVRGGLLGGQVGRDRRRFQPGERERKQIVGGGKRGGLCGGLSEGKGRADSRCGYREQGKKSKKGPHHHRADQEAVPFHRSTSFGTDGVDGFKNNEHQQLITV